MQIRSKIAWYWLILRCFPWRIVVMCFMALFSALIEDISKSGPIWFKSCSFSRLYRSFFCETISYISGLIMAGLIFGVKVLVGIFFIVPLTMSLNSPHIVSIAKVPFSCLVQNSLNAVFRSSIRSWYLPHPFKTECGAARMDDLFDSYEISLLENKKINKREYWE